MATLHAATLDPVIDGNIFEEADKFEKRGNWTEDRHDVLKNLTFDDIIAEAKRLEAENPGRFSTPEEIDAKIMRLQEELAAKRRAELAGASEHPSECRK
ncbi:MAG: hypothetical protein LBB74_01365 [Chitinispirillales bacterium]|jgi:hypothetical protein|nr:hypothetical protein [Chitinispirillales bacterium]